MKKSKRKEAAPERSYLDFILPFVAGIFFVCLLFVTSFTGFESFRLPKDVFSFIAIPLMVILFVATRRLDSLKSLIGDWEILLAGALIYSGIHTFASSYPSHSLKAWLALLHFVLLYFVLRGISNSRFQRGVWTWAAAALAINAIFTILQYYGMFPLMLRPTGEALAGRLNPAGFIGDVNTGGFFFGLITIILAGEIILTISLKRRLFLGSLLLINLLGLFYTRTLTAIGALGICTVLWVLLHQWWLWRRASRLHWHGVLVFWGVLALGFGGVGIAAVNSGVMERVQLVLQQVREGDWNLATAGRQPVYWITWRMIQEDPWMGKGLHTFGRDFFQARVATDYGQEVDLIDQPGSFREAHNEYLQAWEELGVLGLLLLIALLILPLIHSVRYASRESDPDKIYQMGILSLAVVFVGITCMTFFPLRLSASAAFIVLLMARIRFHQNGEQVARVWKPGGQPILSLSPRMILAVGGLLMLLPFYQQTGRWRANYETGLAAFLVNQTTTAGYDAEQRRLFAGEALRRLNRAEDWAGDFYEIYNLKGSAHMVLGNYRDALDNYRLAANNIPGPEVYTNLAAAHIARDELEPARSYLKLALAYNPEYRKAQQAREFLDGHN